MSVLFASIVQLKRSLTQLESWLDKAAAHAKAKSFDVDAVLVGARLAPDQYPFARQVQAACDAAKFVAARLANKEAPKHPDTETTFAQLRARVQSCTQFLGTFTAADYAGAEERLVELPFLEGRKMKGVDYLLSLAVPNFYFHVTHAYAILRHNGVDLGKRDFIGIPPLV